MPKIVYDSDWEKLIGVGFELVCSECNSRKKERAIYEYNKQKLDDFLETVKIKFNELSICLWYFNEYYGDAPSLYCDKCHTKMVLSRFIYLETLTRNKKIFLE